MSAQKGLSVAQSTSQLASEPCIVRGGHIAGRWKVLQIPEEVFFPSLLTLEPASSGSMDRLFASALDTAQDEEPSTAVDTELPSNNGHKLNECAAFVRKARDNNERAGREP